MYILLYLTGYASTYHVNQYWYAHESSNKYAAWQSDRVKCVYNQCWHTHPHIYIFNFPLVFIFVGVIKKCSFRICVVFEVFDVIVCTKCLFYRLRICLCIFCSYSETVIEKCLHSCIYRICMWATHAFFLCHCRQILSIVYCNTHTMSNLEPFQQKKEDLKNSVYLFFFPLDCYTISWLHKIDTVESDVSVICLLMFFRTILPNS